MDNDRRKTFATPLEFWQWAIMEPGKRKARTHEIDGEVFFVRENNAAAGREVELASENGVWLSTNSCPLTAVEDEHGVIPEPEPEPNCSMQGRLAEWLGDIGACEDPYDRRMAAKNAAEYVARLIDERIAAATVEKLHLPNRNGFFSLPGAEPLWVRHDDLRLKPKGDA